MFFSEFLSLSLWIEGPRCHKTHKKYQVNSDYLSTFFIFFSKIGSRRTVVSKPIGVQKIFETQGRHREIYTKKGIFVPGLRCSNSPLQYFLIKISVRSDLIAKRTNPGFFNLKSTWGGTMGSSPC